MRRAGILLGCALLAVSAPGPTTLAAQGPKAPASGRRVVAPAGGPVAGSYSPGVQVGQRLFLSGQLGRDPKTGELLAGIREQTRQALQNAGAVLAAAGMGYEHLVTCHVYLASMDDYGAMNQMYASVFRDRGPARTTVEAVGLPRDALVEIGCVAYGDAAGISVVQPPAGSLPTPLGPYSAAVWAGDTLYLSGMGGQFPEGRRLPDPLRDQMAQALVNVQTTLHAAQLRPADVVSSTTYFTGPGFADESAPDYDAVFHPAAPPPRTMLVLGRLPGAIKTEVTFVAVRPTVGRQVIRDEGTGPRAVRGVLAGDVLYTRGESAPGAGAGVDRQFATALDELRDTVRRAGLRWTDVVHVNVYLADMADFAAMDRLFREAFPADPPARTTIRVNAGEASRVQVSLTAAR